MEKFLDNFINEDRKKKTLDDDWGWVGKISWEILKSI